MAKKKKKPAVDYVMELAEQRGKQALESYRYALVLAVLFVPTLLYSIITLFWLGVVLSIAGLWYAYRCYQDGQRNTQGGKNAEQGAAAEREVKVLLKRLKPKGWQIDHNVPRRGKGDFDVVLHSPKGKWYVIDVKSHGGTKFVEGGVLKKRYGNETHDFNEGDLIRKVRNR